MLLSIAPPAGPWNLCDMALFDIISTHEINIIQYLITIYITMIVERELLDG
jgi:hypothetical protein